MSAFELRPAVAGDAGRLGEIRRAAILELAGAELGSDAAAAWLESLPAVSDVLAASEVWLAGTGDALAGWVEMRQNRVAGLWVEPAQASRGLGSQLLQLAERRLQDRGYTEVRISPRSARAFFEHRGYRSGPEPATLTKGIAARDSYDEVALLYHEARPGYPEELIDDVVAFSGIGEGGRILEVGCGTGKATLPFARRGYRMTCIEPGEKLAEIASAECAAFPDVEVKLARFEDWLLEQEAFDLLIAAQAFHWVDPETGYTRAGAALRRGGALALFWNQPFPGVPEVVRQKLDVVYRERAPGIARADATRELARSAERMMVERIDATGLFGGVEIRTYPWATRCDTESYLKLMRTHSDHSLLPADTRGALLEGIRGVLDAAGGEVEVRSRTLLMLSRRC